jgi:hypothetical protein
MEKTYSIKEHIIPNLEKKAVIQIQEALRTLNREDQEKNISKAITVKH